MSLNAKQKELVQKTWAQVAPISETAAELFYNRLFEVDPSLKPMFSATDLKQQGRMLMQALGLTVKGLDNLPQLVPLLQNLGRRHTRYGVRDEHYDTVGEALLWTLNKGLGKAFTAPVKKAWTEAYVLVASVMKEAAQQQQAA